MKTGIKRLAGVVLTVILICFFVNRTGYLLRPVKTDIAINAINTFHNMPDNTFEVIGYGSSHMWRGMSAMELYEKYGIGAYNYGCNWQNINTTALFLEDSLKTQKPKVVLIETYHVNALKYDTNLDGEIYYTTAISEGDEKQSYLKQCFGEKKERYVSYYMPLCAFHDNWTNISKASFEEDSTYTFDFRKTMGFVESEEVKPVQIPEQSGAEQCELSELSLQTLDHIMNLCKENEIDVIFYTAPWQGENNYREAMKEYAAGHGCVYFDLFEYLEELDIDPAGDFSDEGHLNTAGAEKVADFLGDYLVKHYELTDFRNKKNTIWEQARTSMSE